MKVYKVIGLMSGTSLDGLDLAHCHLWEENGHWQFALEQTHSIDYSQQWHQRLQNAIYLKAEDLLQLHHAYGTWLWQCTKRFIKDRGLSVDFIASHGHTAHHRPELGLTFQLGSGQHIANETGITTICDFRANDVALGGQGAPLVPIGDRLLFSEYDFCLNLGGISNVSFERDGKRLAYDIGMANMPLNHLSQKMGLPYDKDGDMARKGHLDTPLLQSLNALGYYKVLPPKSTGYEWFTQKVVPILNSCKSPLENQMHTLVHHNCEQISRAIPLQGKVSLLVTCGGTLNSFFMEVLQEKLGDNVQIVTPSQGLINFKEALVFALMGVLRMENKVNVLASVTGAQRDSSSGVVHLPN
ncbi:MAG: anhydro-N-acetylmuramic acid kinase [Flavobacteriaceae bacterium]